MVRQRQKKNLFNLSSKPESELTARMMMGASPQSIGAELRAARLARGESTADVARHLRLRENYIDAIERGSFDTLPGVVYAVGFLRSYARHLRLDAEDLIQRFKEEVSDIPQSSELAFFEPVAEESRVPRGGLVAMAVLLAVIAYGGWYYLSTRDMTMADLVPAVPEQFAGLVAPTGRSDSQPPAMTEGSELAPPGPGDGTDFTTDGTVVDGAPAAPENLGLAPSLRDPAGSTPSDSVAAAPTAPRAIPQVPAVGGDAGARSDAAEGPRVYGEGNVGSRITVRAVSDSWVQVRAADESLLMTRTMRQGDSYLVPNQPGLKLMTGNAGVLEILVDGQMAPSLGPLGSVRRNVLLEPDRLKAGTAVVN